MRASEVRALLRSLALVTVIALAACGSGQVDACADAPSGSCLTLEISGPSKAKVDKLVVSATGAFEGEETSSFDHAEALPVRVGVVPKVGALNSVTLTVTGFDADLTVGVGTVPHDLVADDRAVLHVELEAVVGADMSMSMNMNDADTDSGCAQLTDAGCSTVGKACVANSDCLPPEGCDVSTHQCDPDQCHDGIRDGTETAIDCGGGSCAACAPGNSCSVGTDCVGSNCVDSICCSTACGNACHSCSIPNALGACTALPSSVSDTVNVCENAVVCEAGGQCVTTNGKAPFAAACSNDTDCFNGVCQGGYCKLALGDPCGEDIACGSNLCTGNVCTACASGNDCSTQQCTSGVCALPGGAPCAVDTDCLSTSCSPSKFCDQSGSETCTAATCTTHFCMGGVCQSCSSNTDCPMDTACTGGECLSPTGAFCTAGTQCASGTCVPTSLLSFPHCM